MRLVGMLAALVFLGAALLVATAGSQPTYDLASTHVPEPTGSDPDLTPTPDPTADGSAVPSTTVPGTPTPSPESTASSQASESPANAPVSLSGPPNNTAMGADFRDWVPGDIEVTYDCNPAGTSVITTVMSGNVHWGPYYGAPFTESIVVTVGPHQFDENGSPILASALVQDASAEFTIDAGSVTITGTKEFEPNVHQPNAYGTCAEVVGWYPHFRANADAGMRFTAKFQTPHGCFTEVGYAGLSTNLAIEPQTEPEPAGMNANEQFYSSLSMSATPCDGAPPDGLVTRNGSELVHDGEPYTFVGMNVYNANTRVHSCWYPFTQAELEDSFVEMGPEIDVIRAWFFQDFATVDGERSWAAFDETVAAAKATGKKLIITLGNQWPDCDTEGLKTRDWYESGYAERNPALPASYRDYVAEAVARYAGESTVLMWQLLNEAEVPIHTPEGLCDEAVAHAILKNWAADVSALIKSIDPHHLVSIGTIGSGQCGAQYTDYKSLHDLPTVDLCEFHDYGTDVMPGDQWNGLAFRIQQCGELNKPIFIGETGITPDWLDGTLQARAELFNDKLTTQMGAGVVGEVFWAWNAFESRTDTYDIGPGDPLFGFLRPTVAPAAINDVVAMAAGGALTEISPLDNDTDADGDALVIESVTQPQRGTVDCDTTTCRYTPETDDVTYDWFTYVVDDQRGGTDEAVVELWWAADPGTPDEALAPVDDTWGQLWWPHGTHYNGRAQSFTASTTGDLARIDLSLAQWEVTDEWLTVEIREGDDPTGPVLTTGLLRQDGIPLYESAWVYAWKPVGFTNPVRVEAGEQYTIVLAPADKTGEDVPGLIWWGTGDVYVRGTGYTHDIAHGPATPGWSEIEHATGVIDLGFRAYVLAADADADGVDDSIDTGAGTFDDRAGTVGSIVGTAGHEVLVSPDPGGVRITVTGTGTDKATFTVCGFILRLAPGSEVVVSCGSITTRVISGSAELVLGDGLTVVTVPEGVSATLDEAADGSFSLSGINGGSVTVVVDGVSNTVAPGQTLTLQTWQFIGFAAPIDNGGVRNAVKAGQIVPLKWRLLDAGGAPVTDLVSAKVSVTSLACTAGTSADQLEETGVGASGLQNLGDGYYQFNWKPPKNYANSCKTMRLDIGDGVLHAALFEFKK